MNLARLSLGVMAVTFLGLGTMSLIAPQELTRLVEISMPTPVAMMEVRGVYGGLFFGIGAFFFVFARHGPWFRPGLVAQVGVMRIVKNLPFRDGHDDRRHVAGGRSFDRPRFAVVLFGLNPIACAIMETPTRSPPARDGRGDGPCRRRGARDVAAGRLSPRGPSSAEDRRARVFDR